jgi:hypothetical protein
MKLNHSTGAIAFLLATPLVTGLTVGIAPSSAAIIAGSAAAVSTNNFSHKPQETDTVTNTYTPTIANSRSVISETTADKVFLSNSHELLPANLSHSRVQGDGNNYSGFAQIEAAVIGDFAINAEETFSFNFQTVLDLLISVDNRQSERGSTSGTISLLLINTVTNILLDSFQLVSGLDSYSGLYWDFSASDSFNPTPINFNSMTEGRAVQSLLSTSGVYSRTFDSATNLRLVEVKNNIAEAEAEAVPEPSTLLGTAIFLGLFARRRKLNNKLSPVTSKV